ncbi:MAG TPA: HAMP domain-containing sensor histidine kinase [Candidatus Binatia bacterium]|nr:HAMP domain-containing sensor histidine kinase [Candidatus Binatia bacterium]
MIAATAYLLVVEEGFGVPPLGAILLVVVALVSNVFLSMLDRRFASSSTFDGIVILVDTGWITLALLQSGHFSADFFYLYFFILLLAAIGENLALIALGALVVCAAYVYLLTVTGNNWSFWNSPSLIRIPFLFTSAAFYGYLVEQTRRARRKANEADRIKSEFLGTISHELRTPLNVILGYVDLLLDSAFGPLRLEQARTLELVRNAGTTLHGFIGHLLDVSRIINRLESGQERVICSDVELADLFEELRLEFPAGLTIPITWPSDVGLPILHTDREKLATILRNLVQNAVKYTHEGSVAIDARYVPASDDIEVRVIDTGCGIPSEELAHIFEAFRRARTAPPVPTPAGVGLGLYIVKQFVELLDGRVDVVSTPGVGSTFALVLPRHLRTDCGHATRSTPVRPDLGADQGENHLPADASLQTALSVQEVVL